jgi:hypothetical protein
MFWSTKRSTAPHYPSGVMLGLSHAAGVACGLSVKKWRRPEQAGHTRINGYSEDLSGNDEPIRDWDIRRSMYAAPLRQLHRSDAPGEGS